MKQNELLRELHKMENSTLNEDKKKVLTEAANTIFKTPIWEKMVDKTKKVYPYGDNEDVFAIKGFCRFVLSEPCLVWFTKKYSYYNEGRMEVLGPTEFDGGFYDSPKNEQEMKHKEAIEGIYIIPISVLACLTKK